MAFPPSLLSPVQNAPPINPVQRAKLARAVPTVDLPRAFNWQTSKDIETRNKALNKPIPRSNLRSLLSPVVNQAKCGNCWACASATAMTDRLNIAQKVDQNKEFSEWDGQALSITWLASCDRACAIVNNPLTCVNGCNGADVGTALRFLTDDSSGGFASVGCLPELDIPFILEKRGSLPKLSQCELSHGNCDQFQKECNICTNNEPMTSNVFVKKGSVVRHTSAEEIKQDIYAYGPLVGTFQVLKDFENESLVGEPAFVNNGGIYIESADAAHVGFHAVVIVGWGQQSVATGRYQTQIIPYWVVRNSWSPQWGAQGYWKHAMQNSNKNINMRSGLEGVAALGDSDPNGWLGRAGGSISFDAEIRGASATPAPKPSAPDRKLTPAHTDDSGPDKVSNHLMRFRFQILGAVTLLGLVLGILYALFLR
jgi:hypothetical protein